MEPWMYLTILFICLLFNTLAFVAIWLELRSQRANASQLVDRMMSLYAGVIGILLEHGEALATIKGLPFSPATLLEKLEKSGIEIRLMPH